MARKEKLSPEMEQLRTAMVEGRRLRYRRMLAGAEERFPGIVRTISRRWWDELERWAQDWESEGRQLLEQWETQPQGER